MKAFTIVELLIVVTVIGILAAITIVSYNGVQKQAIDKNVLSDLDAVAGEVVRYSTQHNGEYGTAVEWYSGDAPNANIEFTPTSGNVIDVVASDTDYCVRVYNLGSQQYTNLALAATAQSADGVCAGLPASAAAVADSP